MVIHNVEQKSAEWLKLRLDYPLTASEAQAIANGKQGLNTLCWKKMAQRESKGELFNYTNEHIERGNELEDSARGIYELQTGQVVKQVGFITNPDISPVAGVSPDGLVGDDGLIEIKCFEDVKHYKMIKLGIEIESQYDWQMQMQMLITGRQWCDFVAYNPNYSESILVEKVVADKSKQAKILAGLKIGEKLLKDIEEGKISK